MLPNLSANFFLPPCLFTELGETFILKFTYKFINHNYCYSKLFFFEIVIALNKPNKYHKYKQSNKH